MARPRCRANGVLFGARCTHESNGPYFLLCSYHEWVLENQPGVSRLSQMIPGTDTSFPPASAGATDARPAPGSLFSGSLFSGGLFSDSLSGGSLFGPARNLTDWDGARCRYVDGDGHLCQRWTLAHHGFCSEHQAKAGAGVNEVKHRDTVAWTPEPRNIVAWTPDPAVAAIASSTMPKAPMHPDANSRFVLKVLPGIRMTADITWDLDVEWRFDFKFGVHFSSPSAFILGGLVCMLLFCALFFGDIFHR